MIGLGLASEYLIVAESIRGCVFCDIVAGEAPATVVEQWPDAIAILPLHPVTFGHILVIPIQHVSDVTENPEVSAATMRAAAELAERPCNIITSAGEAASQSIGHLHLHVVPRRWGDGLALPWAREGLEGGSREASVDETPAHTSSQQVM